MNLFYYAPHWNSLFPDGAGHRADFTYKALTKIKNFNSSILQTKNFIAFFENGNPRNFCKLPCFQTKIFFALVSLVFHFHYVETKHINFLNNIGTYLFFFFKPCNFFYIHFLWSFPSVQRIAHRSLLVIDTHNYDPDWWDNLEANSKWPWERRLCRISKQRILKILVDLPKNTLLVHVSQEDADKYRRHRPDLTHLVLPNGCTIRPRSLAPAYSAPIKRIYFLGALNLQITRDAILHFGKTFWPQFSSFCEFHLIGSGPTAFWKPFCAERGWHLHNNVPDDDLTRLLTGMHYLVLPFTYGAGSKLKFIDACARGIPVISTPPGVCGFTNLPPTVRISEDPQQWAFWISSPQGPTEAETSACLDFAKEYSWDNLVAKVWPQIQNHPPVP